MNLVSAIRDLTSSNSPIGKTHVICIDGRAGAGKTTLAAQLAKAFDGSIQIHMDDLYQGWTNALGPALTQTLLEIIAAQRSSKALSLPIFDWNLGKFASSRVIPPCKILFLEGVGSAQRKVREFASTTIWLDIESEIGIQRVLERDGFQIENQMRNWQIAQESHFRSDKTRENAHFIVSTGAPTANLSE